MFFVFGLPPPDIYYYKPLTNNCQPFSQAISAFAPFNYGLAPQKSVDYFFIYLYNVQQPYKTEVRLGRTGLSKVVLERNVVEKAWLHNKKEYYSPFAKSK